MCLSYLELNMVDTLKLEVGLDNLYFQDIIDGKEIHLPVYDFKTHSRVVGRFTVSQSANQSSE